MDINTLVQTINTHLAGEMLSYNQLRVHLDTVINEINARLNSTFPLFSEFTAQYFLQYPNYNFFPSKYLGSVVAFGAAYYFYLMDEEGAEVAPSYSQIYQRNLFYMERDYMVNVPEEYQSEDEGAYVTPTVTGMASFYDDIF